MVKIVIVLICALVIVSCVDKGSHTQTNNDNKIEIENLKLIKEASEIFGGNILINERSFSSYSSYKVFYEIKDNDLTLHQWMNKDHLIKEKGWKFLKKKGNGYIYCKGKIQLEVVVPKTIANNVQLEGGDMLIQLEDEWAIGLDKPKTTSITMCERNAKKN